MGRVFIRRGSEVEWEVTRTLPGASAPAFGVRRKVLGDDVQGPWVRLAEYAPGYEEPAHAHDADEVLYILAGELRLGEERYHAGDLLFIERNTVYGPLKAGPQGFQFLLVRNAPAEYIP